MQIEKRDIKNAYSYAGLELYKSTKNIKKLAIKANNISNFFLFWRNFFLFL
ncbi:MAG: hypothetical protein JWP44_2521, partial [Mucilaginibacter sp.]|nr:hypothetical protein [Mucilaginibacter sp.]